MTKRNCPAGSRLAASKKNGTPLRRLTAPTKPTVTGVRVGGRSVGRNQSGATGYGSTDTLAGSTPSATSPSLTYSDGAVRWSQAGQVARSRARTPLSLGGTALTGQGSGVSRT